MLDRRAESTYERGLELMSCGRTREALPFLRAACDLDGGAAGPLAAQGRYLASYGLCLAQSRARVHEALRCCRRAVEAEPYRADTWWSLGRVALGAGRRAEAFRALDRAHSIDPEHPGILRDRRRLGTRRAPVLGFLTRQHPLNVFLGRLRPTL